MNTSKHYFAIGLFTLLGFVLLAAGCVLFGGADLFSKKTYFETYFDSSVQGLDIGSAVKFRGVRLGSVEAIGFAGSTYALPEGADPRPSAYIRVLCSIDLDAHPDLAGDALQGMVANGLRANLALQGITGQLFVNLDFPRTTPKAELPFPWKPDTLYLPSTPTTLQNFLNIAQDIAANLGAIDFSEVVATLQTLTTNINDVVVKADIPALTASFTQLGNSLTAQSERLGEILSRLDAARIGDNLKTLSDNLAQTSDTLRGEIPALADEVRATLADASALLRQANEALAQARKDLDTRALAQDLDDTLSALARTTAATEALVQELRQKPSRLIFDEPLED